MKPVKNVDEYIAQAPKEVQGKLQELRTVIKDAAPNAEERISYGMPYYEYKGRLVYFQLWKKHIGFYVPTPVVEEQPMQEVSGKLKWQRLSSLQQPHPLYGGCGSDIQGREIRLARQKRRKRQFDSHYSLCSSGQRTA